MFVRFCHIFKTCLWSSKTVEGFCIDEDVPEPVIHAFLGAYIARERLGVDSEIEDAIINELFRLSYLENNTNVKTDVFVDPTETIRSQLVAQKRKLSRLFDFEDDDDDEVLRDKILECKRTIRELETQLRNEDEHQQLTSKINKARTLISSLKTAWETMTAAEKQAVCRELIEKIVVYKDGNIKIYLKLQHYVLKHSSDNV